MKFLSLIIGFLFLSPSLLFAQSYSIGALTAQKNMLPSKINRNGAATEEGETGKKGGTKPSFGTEMQMGIQYQIHILGQVDSPGTYRLSPSTRLDEALSKANGVVERGSQRRIEIRRDGSVYRYDLFQFYKKADLNQNPFLLDNDVIFVPFAESTVAIRGPVKTNGIFELTEEDKTAWDLVQLSGGYTTGVSFRDSVTVVRFSEGKKETIKVANVQQELKNFSLLNGDIVVVPHLLGKGRHFDYDFVDLPADNLYIPSQKNEIFITGAVANPGAQAFNPGYSVIDFVKMAGPSELAKLDGVYVLTDEGKYVRNPKKKKDFHLSPGDTIVVPRRAVTTDNVLRWYNTVTGSVFTGFAFRELLR